VEVEEKILVLKRIAVTYRLRVDEETDRERLDRAFEHHPAYCPVYRSLHPQIEITTALELVEG
jgi:uncharacterized OsmC-like protein